MFRTSLATVSVLALACGAGLAETAFNRISSFPVASNAGPGDDPAAETSSEIISASKDGMTLVYTDSPAGVIGMVDITDPAAPKPLGRVAMGGEPTSVKVFGATAMVAVNTSENYVDVGGKLVAVEIGSGKELASCDLGGQPDSIAGARDGSFLAIAIENERDEDLNGGALPQMPAGSLVILPVAAGLPECSAMKVVDLTGLAEIAPEDPEPEFVDVNGSGEIVVTLQENNHIVVVGADGTILSHFPAGTVDLTGIDATDEKAALIFDEDQPGRRREPDAVRWLDDTHLVTANEGDYQGGSRSWTIFAKDGTVVHEDGGALERAVIRIGHYPDRRSDAKGIEPEGMEVGYYDGVPMIFVGAERASVVGVYDATDPAAPVLKQILPSGIGPEGLLAIPERGLFVTANETDLGEDGAARSHVMIYALQDGAPAYPMLTSEGMEPLTGWGAISGLVAEGEDTLWAVNDSFYSYQPRLFRIDTSRSPAHIVEAIDVTRAGRPAQKLDMEGVTLDGKGGFWVASEGRSDRLVPHALYHLNAGGEITEEVALPPELLAQEKRFGFEGITLVGSTLWMAVQREWGDDPKGQVKLVAYDTESKEWGAVRYPLDAPTVGWVGLSEIAVHGDWVYVVERDNQLGDLAVTKRIYRVALDEMVPAAPGGELPLVEKELVRDLIPDLKATGGFVLDKVEGLAITPEGTIWVATDNDGVDDHSGETMLFTAGTADQ
ncbi:esterase-like activity of phytase family protein [Frigidibacter sp. ROC022]|uniref:esterase-like activity of phytase family protein n=1 Tax=Frigidibacter sp. ROC022 TaxID=2971796 RepID=UPI00215B31A9|nr:esterase-like activity of phytase family protein [Frigidibacter sp. ROC022]MCR8722737.1 esterase-like activity of phytase family protein [Frigidibacter sp. ROC022]